MAAARAIPTVGLFTLFTFAASGALAAPEPGEPGTDARALVERMARYLAQQKTLRFHVESTTQVVTTDGQKLDMDGASDVRMRRPNKIRSDRVGPRIDASAWYDGKQLVVQGKRKDLYASAEAPPTIDGAVDFAREALHIDIPAADLFTSDAAQVLLNDVTDAMYLGRATIDGVSVDHVALRTPDTDVQLWIEAGPRPLPRKYVVTSKDIEGEPQFTAYLDRWAVNVPIPDSEFAFRPAPGARRVDFLGLAKKTDSKGVGQ